MKTENGKDTYKSVFLKATVCSECDWFQSPYLGLGRDVCPVCGNPLELQVGQFILRDTGFLKKTHQYVGFERKV